MASDLPKSKAPIQSTAGAIPIRNEKGEISMQKVKVSRYVTGKRPEWQAEDSSEEEEDADFIHARFLRLQRQRGDRGDVSGDEDDEDGEEVTERETEEDRLMAMGDRRLRRLQGAREVTGEDEEEDRLQRHRRRVLDPEVIGGGSDEDKSDEGSESEEEVAEDEIERRRVTLRERARERQQQEELMDVQDEEKAGEGEEGGSGGEGGSSSSEYEEYTDSEEEETGPRLKPVFVRKRDRVTIQEKERQVVKEKEMEQEAKKLAEERKVQARKLVELVSKQEFDLGRVDLKNACEAIDTDDEEDEEEYDSWKVRELKRMKRDKEARELISKERAEAERLRGMTEEERLEESKINPKEITNKPTRGKLKFLQKYYHRGAFFMDEDQDLLKRDNSGATLEDHFDKTVLPKAMQVKNFGRSGRTKYTHLVDQDTTEGDSPWVTSAQSLKFQTTQGGGMKQTFEKPLSRKKKL